MIGAVIVDIIGSTYEFIDELFFHLIPYFFFSMAIL